MPLEIGMRQKLRGPHVDFLLGFLKHEVEGGYPQKYAHSDRILSAREMDSAKSRGRTACCFLQKSMAFTAFWKHGSFKT